MISKQNLDEWFSHRLIFYSGIINGQEKEGVVFFENGFTYNPGQQTIQANSGHIPRSVFTLDKGSFSEKLIPGANVIYSVLILNTDQGYKCILLDRELAGSMFVRLYFFNGQGLKHFVPLMQAEDGSNSIRFFNIRW